MVCYTKISPVYFFDVRGPLQYLRRAPITRSQSLLSWHSRPGLRRIALVPAMSTMPPLKRSLTFPPPPCVTLEIRSGTASLFLQQPSYDGRTNRVNHLTIHSRFLFPSLAPLRVLKQAKYIHTLARVPFSRMNSVFILLSPPRHCPLLVTGLIFVRPCLVCSSSTFPLWLSRGHFLDESVP